jgi:hypothetical protein
MRRYGLYDGTRGLTIALAAGIAGLLLWVATLVGVQTVTRFWESMGIVAGAGLTLALAGVVGAWMKGERLRISPTTFLVAFIPTLVCVGWILMATQPGNGWHEGRVVSWSHSIGIMGLVHSLGLWHGVLAFGFGLVLGMSFDAVPALEPAAAAAPATAAAPAAPVRNDETLVADRRGPRWRRRPTAVEDGAAADEPLTAEREAAYAAEPKTVTVGPHSETTTSQVEE